MMPRLMFSPDGRPVSWLILVLVCLLVNSALGAAVAEDFTPMGPHLERRGHARPSSSSSFSSSSSAPDSNRKIRVRRPFQCGTPDPGPEVMSMLSALHEADLASAKGGSTLRLGSAASRARGRVEHERRQVQQLQIDTYLHLVTSADQLESVTAYQMQRQFDRLSGSFARYGIFFDLKAVTRTVNDTWAAGSDERVMKRALRRGTYAALNIYFQTSLENEALGSCSVPGPLSSAAASNPSLYALDGCTVAAGTVPGGDLYGYDEGQTAVHETGHWLGLLHVFQGYSCGGNGDFILDTPSQSQSTDGCPTNPPKDSCPNQPGIDLIHNFMDYSFDECYQTFTPNQRTRMFQMWNAFRAGK
ncbi:MAG: hypothetical protein M1815_001941 [Lichina confinis]|nr:MAG: hypothetical protein M1815_001941 [Lichina confinis]